jgi:hypothetical protein
VVSLVTIESVSKKSSPSFWVNPLVTSLALYLSIVPSGFNFFLNVHLQPTGLRPTGQSQISQVPLVKIESISFWTASFSIVHLMVHP